MIEPETTKRVRASIQAQHKAMLMGRMDEMSRRIAHYIQLGLTLQRDFMSLRREIDGSDTTLRLPVLPPKP